ncbi:hypothetical protein C0W54_07460 [Photobacterium kishitanii]|uniref:Cas10/Cmr2 second palm domain-containing protein n=1 Tax=Photobacterium kishitanii TaxID=318456 RepID=UPI000D15C043|nr:hypothetical protein [Photobacterium kishitanii]PSW62160.1 hypothetical protein C0W54_07460 [Photobacterium kishitanii]
MYCYLFEAKSIQDYLFQSNKLKDVIAASERLDRLIDSTEYSVLGQVLKASKLESDLLNRDVNAEHTIHFLRSKGGAFYSYCQQQAPLVSLRSTWTLTLSQLFPSMIYTDALSEALSLKVALDKAMAGLNAARNTPQVNFPLSSTLIERYSRTGNGAVPLSLLAQRACAKDEFKNDSALDIDTEFHRQAYQAFDMRETAALQDRFTPENRKGAIRYPIDFEKELAFLGPQLKRKHQREAIKDMALIHLDGNGLGILLRQLKSELYDQADAVYCQAFRDFSEALNKATVAAARIATEQVYQHVIAENDFYEACVTLPMRPIVLGGDDVTLFCRADLALDYATTFCRAFKQESERALVDVFEQYLSDSGLFPYITASGGILYHKAGHPFSHSHHLVEALCDKAKVLTKSVYGTQSNKVGPAALAFYRVSNATQSDLSQLLTQAQTFSVGEDQSLTVGQSSYFVDPLSTTEADKVKDGRFLQQLRDIMPQEGSVTPVSMAKWRQMMTAIAQHDLDEAKRIYHRAIKLCVDADAITTFKSALQQFVPKDALRHEDWYWQLTGDEDGKMSGYQSFINDVLIVHHFESALLTKNVKGDALCSHK